MTDLISKEVIVDKRGNHYRFVGLETTKAEADKLCEALLEKGFASATFQREDNHLWEVFTKFGPAEELIYKLERESCDECVPTKKAEWCNPKECKVKAEIEDVLWKERMGFYSLLVYKLRKVREGGTAS